MPQPVEVTRLTQAIEQFRTRQPRDLPDGLLEKIQEVENELGSYAPAGGDSPGQREVTQVAGGDPNATGTPYPQAAKGPDKPSPGQREVANVSKQIEEAAATIAAKLKPDAQGATAGS